MPTTHLISTGRAHGPLRVLIALPVYSGALGAQTMKSLFPAMQRLDDAGIGWEVAIEEGNCHVDDARNSLVRRLLLGECTDLVFIDADVGFDASALVELVNLDRDIVAGVYPKKSFSEGFPVMGLPGERWSDAEGLVEVQGAPTGFMKIKRRVLESLRDREKARAFIGAGGNMGDEPYHPIFERTIANGRRWSGDYAFCIKARNAGFKVWVNPEWRFTHEGNHVWEGTLGDFWRKEARIESPKLMAAIRRLRGGDASFEAFVALAQAWANPSAALPDMLQAVWAASVAANGWAIEAGSGLTTIVAGIAAERTGNLRIIALESDMRWHDRLTGLLKVAEIGTVELLYAPLKRADGFVWYNADAAFPGKFALAICDGPNRDYGRAGLWNVLGDSIRHATWIVDDVQDKTQLDMVNDFADAYGRKIKVLGDAGNKQFAICMGDQ